MRKKTVEQLFPPMLITPNHPVRTAVAGCSGYYDWKCRIAGALNTALAPWDMYVDSIDYPDLPGCEGYNIFAIYSKIGDRIEVAGYVNISWYTMPSGRIEFTTYVTL